MDPRPLLIRNEQAKLTATYLNGIAITIFAVGSVAPTVALVSGATQIAAAGPIAALALSCVAASGTLHIVARSFLKGLQS